VVETWKKNVKILNSACGWCVGVVVVALARMALILTCSHFEVFGMQGMHSLIDLLFVDIPCFFLLNILKKVGQCLTWNLEILNNFSGMMRCCLLIVFSRGSFIPPFQLQTRKTSKPLFPQRLIIVFESKGF